MNKNVDFDKRTKTARELLIYLTKKNVNYVILRNSEEILKSIGHDIDIAVSSKNFGNFNNVIRDFCKQKHLNILVNQHRKEYTCFVIYDKSADFFIKFDVYTAFEYRGFTILKFEELNENSESADKISITDKTVEFLTVVLKELLHRKKLSEKHRVRLTNLANNITWNSLGKILIDLLGIKHGEKILNLLKNLDFVGLEKYSKLIKRKVITQAIMNNFFGSITGHITWFFSHIATFVKRSGLFIVMIGPDGSGKSTLSKFIEDKVKHQLFNNVIYYHGHFGILPRISLFLRKFIHFKRDINNDKEEQNNDIVHSPIKASLYVLYYGLDYFLGRISIIANRARTNLIIFDRYFQDYYIQKMWEKTPKWLLRIVEFFAPQPDLWVFLFASSRLINTRKPELTMEEIDRQQEEMKKLLKRLKPYIIIDTSKNPGNSAEKIVEAFVKTLERRGIVL